MTLTVRFRIWRMYYRWLRSRASFPVLTVAWVMKLIAWENNRIWPLCVTFIKITSVWVSKDNRNNKQVSSKFCFPCEGGYFILLYIKIIVILRLGFLINVFRGFLGLYFRKRIFRRVWDLLVLNFCSINLFDCLSLRMETMFVLTNHLYLKQWSQWWINKETEI